MSTVLLLGASGYIGGQILKELSRSHPSIRVTALLRKQEVADQISAIYPNLRTVIGDLDDGKLIENEASKASIVLNAASNKHIGAATAIHQGLSKSGSPTYWVQISGASALAAAELASPEFDVGRRSDVSFDDLDGIEAIRSIMRAHPSRQMDNYVLDVKKTTPSVKTALVLAPMIYGKGEGPVNQRSIQLPSLVKVTLDKGHAVRVGPGLNKWGNSHIADVGRIFTGLVSQAQKGQQDGLWGEDGIYLTSRGEMTFAEISDRVSQATNSQGLISSSEIEQLSKQDSDKVLPGGSVLFGTNARGQASRATALLGWKPVGASLEDEIPRAVAEEAASRK